MDLLETLEKVTFKLLELAATALPKKVEAQLNRVIQEEKSEIGENQLAIIAKNIQSAKILKRPLCQDTGLISFFIQSRNNFPNPSQVRNILVKVTKKATQAIPLRPNAINFFEGNTGTNVGELIPWIYWTDRSDSTFEITVQLKGGGSSNISRLYMLNPTEGIKGIKKAIIEAVASAGSRGCPPYTIGIGLGGTEDVAMLLAKKALLIPPDQRNSRKEFAEIELDLIQTLNTLGIGIMGLGYGPSVLDVHIMQAARHPASLPVGISFSCWALRYATARITEDKIEYITHEG
ncbi:MAG TPA: fumarate hydratase [Candidatus Deferrimicrobium sp.]|nr:fumarate hydratase [Candidatus Deferrimicrobium sp.]